MTDTLLERLRSAQKLQQLAEEGVIHDPFDAMICRLWPDLDTSEIARMANLSEYKVANRLAQLRDEGAL